MYSVLTQNAQLADGGALFNATVQSTSGGHDNLITGPGSAPSVAAFNTMFTKMATKKGIKDDVTLSIVPSYVIVPFALGATTAELLTSTTPPTVGGDTTGTSGTQNLYGPGGRRSGLTLVEETQLDLDSVQRWYMAASSAMVDTVEYCFLSGEETPVLEAEWDFDRDAWTYKIRQSFGYKAIDFRGLMRNDGVAA